MNFKKEYHLVDLGYLKTGVNKFPNIKKYYSTGSIKGKIFTPEGEYSYENCPSRANREVEEGDVLQARMMSTNKAILINKKLEGSLFSTGFFQFRPPKELVVPKFLYYFLSSKNFLDQKDNLCEGSTQKAINDKNLKKIKIYLPNLSQQQSTVTKLDTLFADIDRIILSNQNSIINLNQFFLNQLNSFFLDNSNNWENTSLGKYYDVRDGTHDSPKYIAQGIPLVTSKNLKKGKIDLTKIKYIKNEDYLHIKKRSGVSVGDVLMAMIGTIGNPVVIKKDNNFAIKNVALFKINQNQSSDFLKFYLSSSFVVNRLMKDAKGATQKFVGLGYLRDFPIKIPSFEKQKEISLKIIDIEKNIETLNNKYNLNIQNYFSLKKSLLSELFNRNKAA
jgi:type I restriction enzyme S subunit